MALLTLRCLPESNHNRPALAPAPLIALRGLRGILLGLCVSLWAAIAGGAEAGGAGRLLAVFPSPNAVEVSPDTPLRLVFDAPPPLSGTGGIEIVDTATGAVVESIDLGQPVGTQAIGGLPGFNYHTVIAEGRTVTFYPRNGVLRYNRAYAVRVTSGIVSDAAVLASLTQPGAWRFTTKAAPPVPGTTRIVIAADGTGDFCTVQGAIDWVPAGNRTPTTLFLRRGTYTGLVCILEKHALTLVGEDRAGTVIAYANNERFNANQGRHPYQVTPPDPSAATLADNGTIYRRGMFLAHRTEDLTLTNLTLRNTTPQGGSQAEAIIVNGTPTARTVLKDVDLFSYQDTLQINGQAYVTGCRIEGDVDFLWGNGPVFFEDCVAVALRSDAYYTQVRNRPGTRGFVFLNCTFDGAPGVTGNVLSRIQAWRFPESEVVLIDCRLGPAVAAAGWEFQRGADGVGDVSRLRFWEAGSRTLQGEPVDASGRIAGSRQLSPTADAATVAAYRDPAFVLGPDWDARAAARQR